MANVYAVKTGNWSDTTVWSTGALPTSADDVYANGFTVTLNQSITVISLRNGVATGITAGGGFSVTQSGLTIGGNIIGGTTTTTVLAVAVGSSGTFTLNGSIAPGAGNGVTLTSFNTVNINGAINSSTSNSSVSGIQVNAAGILNVVGNLTSNNNSSYGINYANSLAASVLNITGSLTSVAGNGAPVQLGSSSPITINITGDITAGTASGILPGATFSASSLTITGNLYASTQPALSLANGSSSVTITHIGGCYASSSSVAISSNNSNVLTVTGPLVCSDGTGANAAGAGVHPISGRWFVADNALTTFQYITRGATVSGTPLSRPARTLYLTDAYAASYPAAGNVRSGTTYGAGNSLTGTCAVPPAGSVALGVPVDATTGTALLTQSDLTNALTTALGTSGAITGISSALTSASAITLNQQTSTFTTSGSIGERLKLVSTVATTAQQLSDALSNE